MTFQIVEALWGAKINLIFDVNEIDPSKPRTWGVSRCRGQG